MKKLLFMAILMAIAVCLASCESKPQGTPLEGNENLLVFEKNGLFSIKQADGVSLLQGNLYKEIKWDANLGIIVAKNDAETTLAWPDGRTIMNDRIVKIEPAGEDFHRIILADNYVYLIAGPAARKNYNITGDGLWGKMKDIAVNHGFVFMKGISGHWGVATISPREGLTQTTFKSVYIVKNRSKFGVLIDTGDKLDQPDWALYDSKGTIGGKEYKFSPKKLRKMLKKAKLPDKPYGVVEVDWRL